MVNPNIFKPRNDWNLKAMMCKNYNSILNGELYNILKIVAKKSNIPIEDLLVDTNKREIVETRQIYFKRAKETTKKTLEAIGKLVGRDHATVFHGIKTVNDVKYLTERYSTYFNEPIKIEPAATLQTTTFTERPRKEINDNPLAGAYSGFRQHAF